MDNFYVYLFIIFVLSFILKGLSTKSKSIKNLPDCEIVKNYKEKNILTENERYFYQALKQYAESRDIIICPKVDLKELFEPTNNNMAYFYKISQKNIDFLLCNQNMKAYAAIELDDKTHERKDRIKNDNFKDELFKNSTIKLIRIPAKQFYTKNYIEEYISNNIFKK